MADPAAVMPPGELQSRKWLFDPDRMTPELKAELYRDLPVPMRTMFTRLVFEESWRRTPADMMCHLDPEKKAWGYVQLLGESALQAVTGVHPNQMWALPSQYGKTTMAMWLVIWLLDRDPTTRIMYVSYDADRAVDVGRQIRDLVEQIEQAAAERGEPSPLRFKLRPDARARGKWMTTAGGGAYFVGVRGAIVGFPEDVLIGDDLLKGWQEANSQAARDNVFNVWRSQIRLRIQRNDQPKFILGTRWHEDDLQARLLQAAADDEVADQWHVVRLPAVAEAPDPHASDPMLRMLDALGRQPGQILEPDRFDEKEVMARRAALGMYLWAAMEQQRPAPPEGNMVRRDWWQVEDALPARYDEVISSSDMKLKSKKAGDFFSVGVWGRIGKDCFLIDVLRGQWDQPTCENAIALMAIRHPQLRLHLVENTGNGPEVMEALRTPKPGYVLSDDMVGTLGVLSDERETLQTLRRRGLGGILPVNPKGDKTARLMAVSSFIEAGDVHLDGRAPWLGIYLEEMSAYPYGTHDDQVDMTSQALARLHRIGVRRRRPTGQAQRETRAASMR